MADCVKKIVNKFEKRTLKFYMKAAVKNNFDLGN